MDWKNLDHWKEVRDESPPEGEEVLVSYSSSDPHDNWRVKWAAATYVSGSGWRYRDNSGGLRDLPWQPTRWARIEERCAICHDTGWKRTPTPVGGGIIMFLDRCHCVAEGEE